MSYLRRARIPGIPLWLVHYTENALTKFSWPVQVYVVSVVRFYVLIPVFKGTLGKVYIPNRA
jgi:hypothetical protein